MCIKLRNCLAVSWARRSISSHSMKSWTINDAKRSFTGAAPDQRVQQFAKVYVYTHLVGVIDQLLPHDRFKCGHCGVSVMGAPTPRCDTPYNPSKSLL